jgi:hypothetical protein
LRRRDGGRDRGEEKRRELRRDRGWFVAKKLDDGRKKLCMWRFQGDKQWRLLTCGPGRAGDGAEPPTRNRGRGAGRRRRAPRADADADAVTCALRAPGRADWAGGVRRWLGRAAAARAGGREAGAARCELGRDAVGRAGGREEREGGRLGRPRWAREGGWATFPFLFSFFFLSLFYLFQFDFMCK